MTGGHKGGRVGIAEAGMLGRGVIRRGNRLLVAKEITPSDLRTLGAVVNLTALYSRRSDRVYLAQIAADAYGIVEAQPWMLEKVRKSLVRLEEVRLIDRRAPTGRPPDADAGPAYWIALRRQETQPGAGLDSDHETQPGAGLTSDEKRQPGEHQKGSLGRGGKAARRRPKRQPGPGGPTEESPGEVLPGEDSENRAHRSRTAGRAADRLPPAALAAVAENLITLAPDNDDDLDDLDEQANRMADLVAHHVDPRRLLEALPDLRAALDGPAEPLAVVALFGAWLEESPDHDDRSAGEALAHVAINLLRHPCSIAIANACTITSGRTWIYHLDESIRVAQYLDRENVPDSIVSAVLDEIAVAGIRHPGAAADRACALLHELGHEPPRRFARAIARKAATA